MKAATKKAINKAEALRAEAEVMARALNQKIRELEKATTRAANLVENEVGDDGYTDEQEDAIDRMYALSLDPVELA